jgi:hypothetical protein
LDQKAVIRKQLLFSLRGGNAHKAIKRAIIHFPLEFINRKIQNADYTPWQLLDHMRRAQIDFIKFITDADYKSTEWPSGYWPDKNEMADEDKWKKTAEDFFEGLDVMEKFVKDDKYDLFAKIPHAPQYTIYREVMVLSNHNSYHLGQLMLMKKMLM